MLIVFRFFLALLLCSVVSVSYAAGPISVTNTQTLNFGVAAKPLSGNVRIIVNRLGNIAPATTATMIDTSSVSVGADKIKGSGGNNSIQIELTECPGNIAMGLSIRNFRARYSGTNFLNSGVALDAPGGVGKFLTYGASLIINSSASTGALTPCYDVSVNYD